MPAKQKRKQKKKPRRTAKTIKKIKKPAKTSVKKITKKKTRAAKMAKAPALKKLKKETKKENANLLITYDPSHTGAAKREINSLLSQINEQFKIVKETEGNLLLKVKDARTAIKTLTSTCRANPSLFASTFHWVPIDKWCKAEIKEMQREISKFEKEIAETERWKMQLNKRGFPMNYNELIVQLTMPVNRKFVDLKNPEKIIQVEVLGKEAGISLLKADEFLDVTKAKMQVPSV